MRNDLANLFDRFIVSFLLLGILWCQFLNLSATLSTPIGFLKFFKRIMAILPELLTVVKKGCTVVSLSRVSMGIDVPMSQLG